MSLLLDARVPERGLDVALEVGDGEVVAVLGANGAGKSTVLAVVAGLLRPSEGRVVLDGTPLTHVDRQRTRAWVRPHERRVALLAQDPLLFPHLTVLDNVAFGPRSTGSSRSRARAQARHWLEQVDAASLADRRPGGISGGQAQRVAIARALATRPRVLLLDEPMAALDVAVAPALRQTLRRVLVGQTALVVTHDALDALLLADRVAVLENGTVVEAGPSRQVLTHPRSRFAARIAGLNMLTGVWQDHAVVTSDGRRVAGQSVGEAPTDGGPVAAVFRPTSVSIFQQAPGGSPRNAIPVVITDLELRGDQVRAHAGALSADVTPQAVAELDLVPGAEVFFTVKATDVAVYAT